MRIARILTLALCACLLRCDGIVAATAPIRLVSARDPALAVLMLVGEGLKRPVLLFDPADRDAFQHYVKTHTEPVQCLQRAQTPDPVRALMRGLAHAECADADLIALARSLWPQAHAAIVVPASDYEWLLRAAAFAGATDSALLVLEQGTDLSALGGWKLDTIYLTPPAEGSAAVAQTLAQRVVSFADPDALTGELLRLRAADPPHAVVIANPSDRLGVFSPSWLSLLAPLVAARHRAPLFLAGSSDAATVERDANAWIDRNRLAPTHVVLVGDELALRSHRVPDPVLASGGPEATGGGTEVRVELFSGIESDQPQDYAVGRIVGEDVARASATLARQIHDRDDRAAKPVVFLSNADRVFALGETISRTTANELRNVSVPVNTYYRDEITPQRVKASLEGTDLMVWEGHARDLTLEEKGGIGAEAAPAYVVLQGCYTLDRSDPFILMDRGTQAIVATSAAIYSASGSAFARALFDALLYDGADLGTAVRDARNYLLAVTRLKRERHHADWTKTYRAALAFTLWGDPTDRPPFAAKLPGIAPAHWRTEDSRLELSIPANPLPEARVGRYVAHPVPRAMLSGLILKQDATDDRRVKELYFTVNHSPSPVRVCPPSTAWDVVSFYAPHTQSLTVLARPDWDRIEGTGEHGNFALPLIPQGSDCPPPAESPPSNSERRSIEQPAD